MTDRPDAPGTQPDLEGRSVSDDGITLAEMGRAINRIERKLDGVTGDHEKRLRELERQNATLRGWLIGAAAAGGLGAASGLTALVSGLVALLGGG